MKLSRSHALLLVGTIAAAACTVESSDDDGNGGQGGEDAGTGGTKGGSAGSGTGGTTGGTAAAGKGGTSAGTSSAGTAGTGTGGASGEGGAPEAGASAEGGAFAGGGENAGGAAGAPSECDDTAAEELTCDDLATSGCSTSEALDAICEMTWTNLKPSISNDARNCMLELSPGNLCAVIPVYQCVDQALHDACPDASVGPQCESILAFCPNKTSITADTCSTYLSGLTENGRLEFVSCMEEWCDFYTCAESLN